ncbi:MAG: amino acid adenylation domain-containing protein [Clostridia bacterium]|nr:amino acid adenylation domain-containing protein [Clostridia bacterium]
MVFNVLTYLRNANLQNPNKIAFSDQIGFLTYRQLWNQARSIGTAIYQLLGGERRRPIFVCIGRNTASISAFFGVISSGCFYVPIDPSLPDQRLADIYRTMEPPLVITTQADTRPLPFGDVDVRSLEELLTTASDDACMDRIDGEIMDTDPLYCIFTSGSTGIPKGVLVSHRSVIDMAEQFSDVFSMNENNVFGNQAPFDFDVSVKDIYLSVKNQATVHILEKALFSAPKRLIERLNQFEVNTLIWSVSAMKILSVLKSFQILCPVYVRLVMFSGEVLPCRVLNDWREHLPQAAFVNLYGPTEITCNCTYYKVNRPFLNDESLPIGRPFPNTGILLMDKGKAVTTPGKTGEICVFGSCLALGYYGDEKRTAASFCQNPLQNAWPQRIYRTGDLGQWNENDELLFLGRADSQVKYMGFRIELGEIEVAANAVSFVRSACCLFDHEKEQLCLFYQASRQDDKALIAALKQALPAFMVPRRLYYFEKLPENRTGKIDRAALRRDYIL